MLRNGAPKTGAKETNFVHLKSYFDGTIDLGAFVRTPDAKQALFQWIVHHSETDPSVFVAHPTVSRKAYEACREFGWINYTLGLSSPDTPTEISDP